jgi:hypothetical protein
MRKTMYVLQTNRNENTMPSVTNLPLPQPSNDPAIGSKPASIAGPKSKAPKGSIATGKNALPASPDLYEPAPGLPVPITTRPATKNLEGHTANVGTFDPGSPIPTAATPKTGIIKHLWSFKRVKATVLAVAVPVLALAGYGLYAAIPHIAAIGATVAASAIAVPILIAVAATLGAVAIGVAGVKIYKGIKAAGVKKAAAKAEIERQAAAKRMLPNPWLESILPLPKPEKVTVPTQKSPPPKPPKELVEKKLAEKQIQKALDTVFGIPNAGTGPGDLPEDKNFF